MASDAKSFAGSSIDGSASSAIISATASSVKSLHRENREMLEIEGSAHFLRVVHAAFPSCAIDISGLLDQRAEGKRRTSRKFTIADKGFREARDAFVSATLKQPLPENPTTIDGSAIVWKPLLDSAIDLGPGVAGGGASTDATRRFAEYTNPGYDNLQMDFLVKLNMGTTPIEWHEDADTKLFGRLYKVHNNNKYQLAARAEPKQRAERWRRKSGHSDDTTTTVHHYPPGASHYVVGEIYIPECTRTKGGDGVQKLLQLERAVQFLRCKEGKESVLDCVAGALLIGPRFDKRARANLFKALKGAPDRFPCLTQLQAAGRLLAFHIPPVSVSAATSQRQQARLEEKVDELEERLRRLEASAAVVKPATGVAGILAAFRGVLPSIW